MAVFSLQLQRALYHRGFDVQRVVGHAGQRVGIRGAFGLAPKVHCAGHTQVGQQGLVFGRQACQVVGAEDATLFHGLPTMPHIAAEVTEVGGACEREGSGGSVRLLHGAWYGDAMGG